LSIVSFDEFYPYDANYGSTSTSARWRKMAQLWAQDGVVSYRGSGLAGSISSTTATLAAGAVWIKGMYAEFAESQSFNVGTTGGLICAHMDVSASIINLYYNASTSTPVQTYPTGNVWELPLFQVSAGSTPTLTDLRVFTTTPFWQQGISYTPVWSTYGSSPTQPVLGNGTLMAYYTKNHTMVEVDMLLTPGSTTTYGAGTGYQFTLPSLPVMNRQWFGRGALVDTSSIDHEIRVRAAFDTTTLVGQARLTTGIIVSSAIQMQPVTATVPVTLAATETLAFSVVYESQT
jgi:hypothetical protein